LHDDALVLVTSDHGEEFFDHGFVYHPMQLYSELTRVPLIVYGHGFAPRRVERDVSTLDILPTLRDILGGHPSSQDQGTSLRPLLEGGRPKKRAIFTMRMEEASHGPAEWKRAVISEGIKYILTQPSGAEELYDLTGDPGEHDNIVSKRPELAARLRARLQHLQRTIPHWERTFLPASKVPDLRELDTLGYGR
jgi:arylsulfatase A-like enzyme